mgnify:CR=1 FL=1
MKIFQKISRISFGFYLLTVALSAQTNLHIEGAGFFQNRALKSRLAFLQSFDTNEPVQWDAALLEDSAFLLLEQLKREGYLQPSIHAIISSEKGVRQLTWSSPYSIQLEADVVAEEKHVDAKG